MRATISDATIVRLLDPDAPKGSAPEWTGRLDEFERANQFDQAEIVAMRADLASIELHVLGGGAAGIFVVEVVTGPYPCTAIGAITDIFEERQAS